MIFVGEALEPVGACASAPPLPLVAVPLGVLTCVDIAMFCESFKIWVVYHGNTCKYFIFSGSYFIKTNNGKIAIINILFKHTLISWYSTVAIH